MNAPRINILDISTVCAFGVEWVNPYSGTTYQFSHPRGTQRSILCRRLRDERLWSFTTINNHFIKPPESYEEFLAVAKRFIQE
jgi:hypothetical protein